MRTQYIISKEEVDAVKKRLSSLKRAALLSRDAGEREDSMEFHLRARGFEEALMILGIVPKQ